MNRCLCVVVLLIAAPLRAQEFDIFDANDFLDPRQRGAIFRPDGRGIVKDGSPFAVIRAYGGRVYGYQWRLKPTTEDVTFAHLVGSLYKRNLQANAKATFLNAQDKPNLPEWRFALQGAYYYADDLAVTNEITPEEEASGETPGLHDHEYTGRILFSAAIEQNGARRTAFRPEREPDYFLEFSGQMDLTVAARGKPVQGSFIVTQRRAPEPRSPRAETYPSVWRLTYFYRAEQWRWRNIYSALQVGIGTEYSRGFRAPELRGVFLAMLPAKGIRPGLIFAYAPTYPTSDNRTFHEVAVFIDSTLWSKLFPIDVPAPPPHP